LNADPVMFTTIISRNNKVTYLNTVCFFAHTCLYLIVSQYIVSFYSAFFQYQSYTSTIFSLCKTDVSELECPNAHIYMQPFPSNFYS
ncbi:hypothetical protein ABHZ63_22540, partial [Phocaeicola vulgatus]